MNYFEHMDRENAVYLAIGLAFLVYALPLLHWSKEYSIPVPPPWDFPSPLPPGWRMFLTWQFSFLIPFGVGVILFGFRLKMQIAEMEKLGGTMEVWWLYAEAYNAGGKWGVFSASMLIGGGCFIWAIVGFWKLWKAR